MKKSHYAKIKTEHWWYPNIPWPALTSATFTITANDSPAQKHFITIMGLFYYFNAIISSPQAACPP